MIIAVVDGQGGGIGRALVERIKGDRSLRGHSVLALGTNSVATGQMLRAGADEGATGENAIVYNVRHADIILGPVGIINANAMMGELSPKMAEAIGSGDALKILLPMNKCRIQIVSVPDLSVGQHVENAIATLKDCLLQMEEGSRGDPL